MKTLYLIRHAKSDQTIFGKDFDRPLNHRGQADAPVMAQRMLSRNIFPSVMLSSPALRAKTTAYHFADAYGVPHNNVVLIDELYQADVATLSQLVQLIPNEAETVFVFCHNMGITYFANTLTQTKIDNMPTCGIFGVSAQVTEWVNFLNQQNQMGLFDFPKQNI